MVHEASTIEVGIMNVNEVNILCSDEFREQEDESKSDKELRAHLKILKKVIKGIEQTYTPSVIEDGDRYGFVPFPCGPFLELVMEAAVHFHHDCNRKFLDVGSGVGTKLLMAAARFDAFGIEISPEMVSISKTFGCAKVFQWDALSYMGYGQFDMIYFYRPFRNAVMQGELESQIKSQLKTGGLVAPMGTVGHWDRGFEKIGKYWFRKVS